MIDYEVKVFNRVHAKVAPLCAKNKFVSTMIPDVKTGFPAASLIELDNRTVRSLQSSTPKENFAQITYQLEVFAKTKSECRKVFSAADDEMIAMNFTRISGQYVDNAGNTEVLRYVGRYQAMVDVDGNLYRV